jgi:hypothetical protein
MNVEFVNPVLVFGLFAPSDAPQPKPGQWRGRLRPREFWRLQPVAVGVPYR